MSLASRAGRLACSLGGALSTCSAAVASVSRALATDAAGCSGALSTSSAGDGQGLGRGRPSPRWTGPQARAMSYASASSMSVPNPSQSGKGKAAVTKGESVDKQRAVRTFESAWNRLVERHGGMDNLTFPREVVWLNGAPGAGKGTQTPYILQIRGLSRAIVMSDLLDDSEELRAIKNRGELINDDVVLDVLLDAIFTAPDADNIGAVVDGYPRSSFQADIMKHLFDRLMLLHESTKRTPSAPKHPRPLFKVVVLYVDEEESIKRQTQRAVSQKERNRRILDAGVGKASEVRTTDANVEYAKSRYKTFKEHYTTLLRLMQYFPFCLIDAMGPMSSCKQQIAQELRYQSSLDLMEETYRAIAPLPLAKEVVTKSRQNLVVRLDSYWSEHEECFREVIGVIEREILPGVLKSSLSGHFEFTTENPLFGTSPIAADILIDVLSDRGFKCSHRVEVKKTPARVDLKTGEIELSVKSMHRFRIQFEVENIRSNARVRLTKVSGGGSSDLGTMVVPQEYDHQSKATRDFARHLEESMSTLGRKKAKVQEKKGAWEAGEMGVVDHD